MDGCTSFLIRQQELRKLQDSGVLRGLPAIPRVLHVECGLGDHAASIARLLPRARVLAVDRSKQAIAQARHRHPVEACPNIEFTPADPESVVLFETGIDLIVSNSPLSTFNEFNETVGSMVGHLNAGGRVWLSSPAIVTAERIVTGLEHLVRQPEWVEHFSGLESPATRVGPTEVKSWLRDAGLVKSYVSVTDEHLCFPGFDAFSHWLSCKWSAYFLRLPGNQRQLFLDALLDIATPKYTDQYCVDFAWLSAFAEKTPTKT